MPNLYYKAPPQEAFEDMRRECVFQWGTHDNTYGYVDEKLSRIQDILNVGDNFMYMFAMFDMNGQRDVVSRLDEETKKEVRERLRAGGNDEYFLSQIGLDSLK